MLDAVFAVPGAVRPSAVRALRAGEANLTSKCCIGCAIFASVLLASAYRSPGAAYRIFCKSSASGSGTAVWRHE